MTPGAPQNSYFAVPQVVTTAGLYNTHARAFSTRWDEALRWNREDARRMLNDPVIKPCLNIRSSTVAGRNTASGAGPLA